MESDGGAGVGVAIVGMSGRFPGHCNDLSSFWELLAGGGDGVTTTDCRWGPDVSLPTCKYGGFLDDVDCFDARFFNVLPKEAVKMDPQHRILLELHWEAMESACIPPSTLRGSRAGVYTGISWNQYEMYSYARGSDGDTDLRSHHDLYLTTGTTHSMAAGQVSFFFDFRGPSMAIDAACSTSLLSLHLGCQALLTGDCDLAFASGVALNLGPEVSTNFTQVGLLGDRCRAFDMQADGYCRSEGAAVVMLKRYADALRDGNRVLGVVRGSAANQNGRGPFGITAPHIQAQSDVYRAALARAGLHPTDVQYIEAHGTGTKVGDPAELQSIVDVYGRTTKLGEWITGIGSVKTNIGHTEMAAGLTGLVKVILSLEYQTIPPNVHFQQLTSHAPPNMADSRKCGLEILEKSRAWPSTESGSRVAAVSSFGFSGSNVHVIVGEGRPKPKKKVEEGERVGVGDTFVGGWGVLTLSAQTKTSLDGIVERYRTYFTKNTKDSLKDVMYTSNVGREHFTQHRSTYLLHQATTTQQVLSSLARPPTFHGTGAPPPEVEFVLTGSCIGGTDAIFRQQVLKWAEVAGVPSPLASFVEEYCIAATLQHFGIKPSKYTCYGSGEWVGAVLAGVMSLTDAVAKVQLNCTSDGVKHFNCPGNKPTISGGRCVRVLIGNTWETFPQCNTAAGDSCQVTVTSERDLWSLLALLYSLGASVNWRAVHGHGQDVGKLVDLPKYAFDKKRFWYPSTPLVRHIAQHPKEDVNGKSILDLATIREVGSRAPVAWAPHVRKYEDKLSELCILRIVRTFVLLGIQEHLTNAPPDGLVTVAALAEAVGVTWNHRRYFQHLIALLTTGGYLILGGSGGTGHLRLGHRHWPPATDLDMITESIKTELQVLNPGRECLLELSWRCGTELNNILRGKTNHLKLLFPPSSAPGGQYNMQRFYATSPDLHTCNTVLEELMSSLRVDGGLKILEIGAGTGSTTTYVLRALRSRSLQFEFWFTDISPSFFHDAKQKLGGGAGNELSFKVLDIEKDAVEQGFPPSSFDIVIGSNVVHATRSVAATLDNLKRVLRPGGWLLLCEYVHQVTALDVAFGCLPGWWAWSAGEGDPARPTHAIMAPDTWLRVLEAAGFEMCHCLGFPVAVIIGKLKEGGDGPGGPTAKVTMGQNKEQDTRGRKDEELKTAVHSTLKQFLVKVTGLEADEIDENKTFGEIGFDSLMIRILENDIEAQFGGLSVAVTVKVGNTLHQLVDCILQQQLNKEGI